MSFSLFIWELIYFCMRFSRYNAQWKYDTSDACICKSVIFLLYSVPAHDREASASRCIVMYAANTHFSDRFLSHGKPKPLFLSSITQKSFWWSGGHLLSHTVSSAVPSAVWVLTIVFGMGTGVSLRRIATRYIQLSLDNLTINNNPYFFRFSWIDSAALATYFIHLP